MTDAVRQPDLSIYADFAGLPRETIHTELTTQYLVNGFVYSNPELTTQIGAISSSATRFNLTGIVVIDHIMELPFGTILYQLTDKASNIFNPDSFYFKLNSLNVFTIMSGNGHFIGSKGYVTYIVGDNPALRRIDFWFDKQ